MGDDRNGDCDQRVDVSNVDTVGEIRGQQCFLEARLDERSMDRSDPPQQTVRLNGVRTLSDIHSKFDSGLGRGLGHLSDDFVGSLGPTEFFGVHLSDRRGRIRGRGGIELVGPINDFDGLIDGFRAGRHVAQCSFETTFADVAPGANHVGPDFNLHVRTLDRHTVEKGRSVRVVDFEVLRLELEGRSSADVQATFCAVLVEEWVRQGLTHAVIAPGSRSTPMALALVSRSELEIEVFHDERSASYAALGIALSTGIPAALLCTSGTAAAHFHAAVIEADLSHVPMLVLTADRPPELKDVGAAQTIDQTRLFGDSVRWFHDPGVASIDACSSWRSLARRSFAKAMGSSPGPVHVNLPFREPLVGESVLPVRPTESLASGSPRLELDSVAVEGVLPLFASDQGVIIAGRGCGDPQKVAHLSQTLGWPIVADSRSGCQGLSESVIHSDSLLRDGSFAESVVPQVVVRMGEAPSSKVLSQFVAASGAAQIHVSAFEAFFDPDHTVRVNLVGDPDDFCSVIAERSTPNRAVDWMQKWIGADHLARAVFAKLLGAESASMTAASIGRTVVDSLAPNANIVVSSSMPIRDLEWFGGDCSRFTVFSNRGANGIDGVTATAIGVAKASNRSTVLLIGDIAFVHDSSSLTALASRDVDLKIVVSDNDGGGIFHYLPQAKLLSTQRFEQLFGTPHRTDVLQLAEAHGLNVSDCASRAQLAEALVIPGTRVIRVRTDRNADVSEHDSLNRAVAQALRSAE